MAWLRIEGYEVDTIIEDFSVEDQSVESFSRSMSDSYEGLTYSVKKQVSFLTAPLSEEDAISLEGWICGRYHSWSFERGDPATVRFTKASSDGGLIITGGTVSSSPLYGTWALMLLTGASATATATFGSESDWTIFGYHKGTLSSGYRPFAIRNRDGVMDNWLSGATTASMLFMQLSSASGYLGAVFVGKAVDGNSGTTTFDAIRIAPFALTDGMIAALNSSYFGIPTTGPGRAPFVIVSGHALPAPTAVQTESSERIWTAKGFVQSFDSSPSVIDGAFQIGARQLRATLVQK